jgi:hypothetical protein
MVGVTPVVAYRHQVSGVHDPTEGRIGMASKSNRITMSKRARETKLRERREEKQIKKAARKLAAADQSEPPSELGAPEPEETERWSQ